MKKLGKVLSLVMALALTVCSLSATAFASAPTAVLVPHDAIYQLNFTPGLDSSDADTAASQLIQSGVTDAEIFFKYEDDSYKHKKITAGNVGVGVNGISAKSLSCRFLRDDNLYVLGTYTKIESKGEYHYDYITSMDELDARIIEDYDYENDMSYIVDAQPIVKGDSDSDYYIVRKLTGEQSDYYVVLVADGTKATVDEEFVLEDLTDVVEAGAYIYTDYVDPTQPTTEAPTTTAAATTAAATSPQTGDSAMTATFIALGVVAVCGLAVVTFATKKER